MQNVIEIKNTNVEYTHKVSPRAKRLRVAIYPGGRTVVSAPRFFSVGAIEKFLRLRSDWLLSAISRQKLVPVVDVKKNREDYLNNKERALSLVKERIGYFNSIYNFRVGKISIKNHKTLWGSCSRKCNINFNYRIVFLSPEQRDYIIVHELCHLAEFNHSARFWTLVSKTIPNYKQLRKSLKASGLSFS